MIEAIHINSIDLPIKERRIKKYILVWCSEGEIEMEIDSVNFKVPANHAVTITSGQFHKFIETPNAKGIALQFTYDFFCKDDKDIELIFQNGLFCHFDLNTVIEVSEHPAIAIHLDGIIRELKEKPYQYLSSIHARIELILIEINRAKIQQGEEIWKPDALFLKFLELIRAEFQHSLPVKYYAERLETTEVRLNELSKQHAGKTAQQIIHGLIVSEAKRLFYYEKLSVKETSYALGFNDPFYFSNFFKKHTALSPQLFKEQVEN
ncbi:helix-turn-helix domain-containing protein [Limibacter armeniacum]|uniref:helix-turn-helix domain-containing protein n=1 Tax=Limibacter armeniacum TaxID=466084 RepID=UPI002FE5B5BA